MKTEAKVGAFTLAGLLLLMVLCLKLSGFSLASQKGYTIYAGFHQVIGLEPESAVRLSGVSIGEVKSIENDGSGVTVAMRVRSGVHIPEGSHVTIGSSGVMGEKFINITPAEDYGHYLEDGAYLIGEDEAGMDTMIANINKIAEQAQDLVKNLNSVVADPKFKTSLIQMAVNLRDTTGHLKGLVSELETMAQENRGNVRQMTGNLVNLTNSLQATVDRVDHMMTNMDSVLGDPRTAENIRQTLDNIRDSSDRIQHIAQNLETVAGDPDTMEDLRQTVKNARAVTDKAGKIAKKLDDIEVKPSVSELYTGGTDHFRTDFDLGIGFSGGRFADFGVNDIGDDNLFNAQIGRRSGHHAARGGVIDSKVGLGLDVYAGSEDALRFSLEAYDPSEPRLNLESEYQLGGGTSLLGEIQDVTDQKGRRGYFGLKHSF